MKKVELKEAQKQLADLINKVAEGEEIVITRDDGSTFKIVPTTISKAHPQFGSAKGLISMADNFDESLNDFKEYMP